MRPEGPSGPSCQPWRRARARRSPCADGALMQRAGHQRRGKPARRQRRQIVRARAPRRRRRLAASAPALDRRASRREIGAAAAADPGERHHDDPSRPQLGPIEDRRRAHETVGEEVERQQQPRMVAQVARSSRRRAATRCRAPGWSRSASAAPRQRRRRRSRHRARFPAARRAPRRRRRAPPVGRAGPRWRRDRRHRTLRKGQRPRPSATATGSAERLSGVTIGS